jgi:hypothetical protein
MKEPCMGGIHRTRLAASKAHRHFVKEVKQAVQKMGWQLPRGGISPTLVGPEPLAFPISPVFEAAFGYRGELRFLEFGYTAASHQFDLSDGGDDLPSDASLWPWFLHHPVVSPHLPETRYPTLYGKLAPGTERPALRDILRRGTTLPASHCLLLDRRDRWAHISQRDQTMMLFALVEPEDGDDHTLLMSPGSENYKLPPAPELLMEFRQCMDSHVPVEQGA